MEPVDDFRMKAPTAVFAMGKPSAETDRVSDAMLDLRPVGRCLGRSGGVASKTAPNPDERAQMSEKPMFMYAAVYDDVSGADADYEAIKALHAGDTIGSYGSAIISESGRRQGRR